MRSLLIVLGVAALLGACSAKPVISNVTSSDAPTSFSGVPMRIKTEQIVHIFRLNPATDSKDSQYDEVSTFHQVLADQHNLFAVDVRAAPFASPGLHITENPDNTLKSIETTSTENESGAIDAVTQA